MLLLLCTKLYQSFSERRKSHRVTFTKVASENIWDDIEEGGINKLDNIKCIAANFLWNNLDDQFWEKLSYKIIKNSCRHEDAGLQLNFCKKCFFRNSDS